MKPVPPVAGRTPRPSHAARCGPLAHSARARGAGPRAGPGRRRLHGAAPSRLARLALLMGLALLAVPLGLAVLAVRPASAQDELDPGVNTAGVIDYPTALDQRTANMVHGSISIIDLSAPDLRPVSLRYGRQLGNFQLLADVYGQAEPKREFEYGEVKGKLRVVNLDALRTYFAIGVLARWSDLKSKDETVLDNKPYSLLGVFTTELYPFDQWGAFLVNVYVDNRFADAGLKVQLYQGIRFVTETDYHHGDINDAPHKWRFKAGLEFEGERNFYAQILYDDIGNHPRLQIGTGF